MNEPQPLYKNSKHQYSEEDLRNLVADSYSMRELQRKMGYSSLGANFKTIRNRLKKYGISTDHFKPVARDSTKRTFENVFCKDSTASQHCLREWYLKGKYTEYKCSICGLLPFWNDQELSLTLDHINGYNHDNRLENLRWICPNCDRQLSTFGNKSIKEQNKNREVEKNFCIDCGKQISKYATRCLSCAGKFCHPSEKPSKEKLLEQIYKCNGNFERVASAYGINSNSVRKWCRFYGLSPYAKDYKSTDLNHDSK